MMGDSKLLEEKLYEAFHTANERTEQASKQALQALLDSDSGLNWELGGDIPLSGNKI